MADRVTQNAPEALTGVGNQKARVTQNSPEVLLTYVGNQNARESQFVLEALVTIATVAGKNYVRS